MNGKLSEISLLTAGRDRPYALGLAAALEAAGAHFDFIGSDDVDSPELHTSPQIHFLNLRGDQSVEAGLGKKMIRVLAYYRRLMGYAATSNAKIFHVLWNNKFELFDRTLLMLFYKIGPSPAKWWGMMMTSDELRLQFAPYLDRQKPFVDPVA